MPVSSFRIFSSLDTGVPSFCPYQHQISMTLFLNIKQISKELLFRLIQHVPHTYLTHISATFTPTEIASP